jgi:hypothetical protein
LQGDCSLQAGIAASHQNAPDIDVFAVSESLARKAKSHMKIFVGK